MRLDKYLKISRLIKRRPVAKKACNNGRVSINGKMAKPATRVSVGDELEIVFGNRTVKVRILKIAKNVRKQEAQDMYEII